MAREQEDLVLLLKDNPSFLKPLRIKYSEEKSRLVCDLNSIVAWLSGTTSGNSAYSRFNGNVFDLQRLSSRLTSFVRALRHISIEPVFFSSNVVSMPGCKNDVEFLLPQMRFDYLEALSTAKRTPLQQLYTMNPLMFLQAQLLLSSLDVQIIFSAGNCMSAAVSYATNNKALGLLSYNAEFAFFPGVSFIHIDFFDLEGDINACSDHPMEQPQEVICACVMVDSLSAEFGLLSKARMTDLAILLGNSFSSFLNHKYCIGNFIRLGDKKLKSIVNFVKEFESPVFKTSSKLAYFCDMNKDYEYGVSRSVALYHDPEHFNQFELNGNKLAFWIKEKIDNGLLPSYFYALVKYEVCIRHPFYDNHCYTQSKMQEIALFLRKVIYFMLGVAVVFEYGQAKNHKPFVESKVQVARLPNVLNMLNRIWLLSSEAKCELLSSLVTRGKNSELSPDILNSLIIASSEEVHSIPTSYLILMICLLVFCQNGVCDGHMVDAVYVSILIHLAEISITLPNQFDDDMCGEINITAEFSCILQLMYDLAMLLGLADSLPIPNVIFSPCLCLRLLSLSSSACYCHSCDNYYSRLIQSIFLIPSVQLFKLKALSYSEFENCNKLVQLLNSAVVDLGNEKETFENVFGKGYCKDHCSSPQCSSVNSTDEFESESISSSEASSLVDATTIEQSMEPHSTIDNVIQERTESGQDCNEHELFDTRLKTCLENTGVNRSLPPDRKNSDVHQTQQDVNTKSLTCSKAVYKNQLSVSQHRHQIVQLIQQYRVVCIEGEAGCGKSTMVPQFIVDSAEDHCKVIVCQPRRVSAIKLARHVARLRCQADDVGYCVGGNKMVRPSTRIVYCTTGYFLQILLHCPHRIEEYSHVILDEIHDRTITYDFVTLLLRKLCGERLNSKLILMSATMQGPLFVKYFQEGIGRDQVSKPLYVGNKCYPVEEYFIDEVNKNSVSNPDIFLPAQLLSFHNLSVLCNQQKINSIYNRLLNVGPRLLLFAQEVACELIVSQAVCGSSILVFLPGLHEILEYYDFLDEVFKGLKISNHFSIFVLHSQVPIEEQESLLQPPPSNKVHIILSTNIAESSITIPMLKMVINFGLQKTSKYDYKRRMTRLMKCWCSKAACRQRSGRVGRLSPGKVFHLFPKFFYHQVLPDHDSPEMLSNSLAKTILQARVIGEKIGIKTPSDVLRLAIQPPPFTDMDAALEELVKLGALVPLENGEISETGQLSLLGEISLNLPLDIDLCRLILYGFCFGCPVDAIIIAATLSLNQDCFLMPSKMLIKDDEQFLSSSSKSMDSRLSFDNNHFSDPVMFVRVFWEWIRFSSSKLGMGSTKRNLVNLFSKQHAVHCQRFMQLLSSFITIAIKTMRLLPSLDVTFKKLSILTQFMLLDTASNNGLYTQSIVTEIASSVSNIDRLRTLLVATFMQNLLYGMRKADSSNVYEKTEARRGLLRMHESGFSISRSIVVKQVSTNIHEDTIIEVVKRVVPDCPVNVDLVAGSNIAVIEFPLSPNVFKNVFQFWQFGERRIRWSFDELNIVFDRPYHPLQFSWFCWTPKLEKVDLVTWRNRTALICDTSNDSAVPSVAVAASLEGNDSHTHVKAKFLTLLPSIKVTKLPILLLIAFQSFTSTVMFNVDHTLNIVQSVNIDSQELSFGLWQHITASDLALVNGIRAAMSSVLSQRTCNSRLPVNQFEKTEDLVSILIHPLFQNSGLTPNTWSNLANDLVFEDSEYVRLPYYPPYTCSILNNIRRQYDDNSTPESLPSPTSSILSDYSSSPQECPNSSMVTRRGLLPTPPTYPSPQTPLQIPQQYSRYNCHPSIPINQCPSPRHTPHFTSPCVPSMSATNPHCVMPHQSCRAAIAPNKSGPGNGIKLVSGQTGMSRHVSDRYSHATPCHTETSVLVRCESDVRYNPSGDCNNIVQVTTSLDSNSHQTNAVPPSSNEMMSDTEWYESSASVCFTQPGGGVKLTKLEERLVAFIYSKGRRVSLSVILLDRELQVLALLEDETLSVAFFLKRPQWFRVQMINEEAGFVNYIITLFQLFPWKF